MVVAAAGVAAGCSESDGQSSASTTQAVATSITEASGDSGSGPAESTLSPPSTLGPEPTGVAGLDDADPLCAAWAVYSGTVQSIGIAGAFGQVTSADIARLELVAAGAVADAIERIDAAWPASLSDEHDVVLDDLLGPFGRRAGKALDALHAAGVTDAEVAQLGDLWFDALRMRDPADPVIEVPELPAELSAKVDAAVAAFDAAITPFVSDPSLVLDGVDTPATDAYLAVQCPDLASSGVGDAV